MREGRSVRQNAVAECRASRTLSCCKSSGGHFRLRVLLFAAGGVGNPRFLSTRKSVLKNSIFVSSRAGRLSAKTSSLGPCCRRERKNASLNIGARLMHYASHFSPIFRKFPFLSEIYTDSLHHVEIEQIATQTEQRLHRAPTHKFRHDQNQRISRL